MIYQIDIRLVMLTQWLLEFFEFNTSAQKEDIVNLNLKALNWLIVATVIISTLLAFFVFPLVISFVIISICLRKNLKELKSLHEKPKGGGFLPIEIITRAVLRLAICAGFIYSLLIAILTIHIFKSVEGLVLVLFSASIFSILCSEYLLCTTTLSSGEKQKMKEEMETGNMVST